MAEKTLALRRADNCTVCDSALAAGTRAVWNSDSRTVRCLTCPTAEGRAASDHGVDSREILGDPTDERNGPSRGLAGDSAQREYERRHEARQNRVRTNHPRIGGLLLALVDDPGSTTAWAKGAEGERAVAARLDLLEHAIVLHDRRLRRPGGALSQANIDHLVIAPSGVWVVDAKRYRGRLEVRRSGGLFSPRTEQLWIDGRNRSPLVDGVARQVDAVRSELGSWPTVAVRGALCFVDTVLPWVDEEIAGVAVRGRRGLIKLLRRSGPLGAADADEVAAHLAERFPLR